MVMKGEASYFSRHRVNIANYDEYHDLHEFFPIPFELLLHNLCQISFYMYCQHLSSKDYWTYCTVLHGI